MLQALRERASSWVIKILLGLLVLSFAIWGINDIFLGERDPAVAEIADVKIPKSRAEEAIREEINRLRPLFGRQLDRDQSFRRGINIQVITRLVDEAAVNLGANKLGIVVSDQMANRAIRMDRTFYNGQNQFDRSIFAQALRQASVSEGRYVSNLKQGLATSQLSQAIASNIPLPRALLAPMVRFRSERRTAQSILVPLPKTDTIKTPANGEINAFYKAHPARFTAPEYRGASFIHLDPKVLANEVQIAQARIKQSYDERIEEFTTRARRKISQIVFTTEAAAKTAAANIRKRGKFSKSAKENGKTIKAIDLGWIEKKDLFSELANPVFDLSKGATSAPIKTALGWHIVKVADVQKGHIKPLSEVRKALKADLATREAIDGIFALANKLEDSLAGGATISEAASRLNVKAHNINAVDSSGLDPNGTPIAGLPKSGDFLRMVFQTQSGDDSPLSETEGGGFYILHVDKVISPAISPLEKIRKDGIAAWKSQQRAKIAEVRAKKILDALKNGKKLKALARGQKAKVTTSKPFTRLTHDAESGLPSALMVKLFTIKKGEPAMAMASNGYVVAVLSGIRNPDAKEKTETENRTRDEIQRGIATDLFDQLVSALKQRVTIKTYPERLQNRP